VWETPSMLAYTADSFFLSDGMSLIEYLPPDIYAQFTAYLATYDISYNELIYFTPSTIITMLMLFEVYELVDINYDLILRDYVLEFAIDNDKQTIDLIDAYLSWDMLMELPHDVMFAAAMTLTARSDAISIIQQRIDAYEAQDADLLYDMMRMQFYDEANLYVRHTWDLRHQFATIYSDKIELLLRETEAPTTFFVTLDIDYMLGNDYGNVVNNLQDRGFAVSKLYR